MYSVHSFAIYCHNAHTEDIPQARTAQLVSIMELIQGRKYATSVYTEGMVAGKHRVTVQLDTPRTDHCPSFSHNKGDPLSPCKKQHDNGEVK